MIYLAALVIVIVFAGPFILSAASLIFVLALAFIIKYWLAIIIGAVLFFGSIFLYAFFGDSRLSDFKRSKSEDGDKLPDHKSSDTTIWTQEERGHEDERRRILGMQTLEESESKR